jgi:hypothetical protein
VEASGTSSGPFTPVDLKQHASSLTVEQRQLLNLLHGSCASVWGIPRPLHEGDTSASNLRPCDQAWFHHRGFVHHVATVMAVFDNLKFDRSLWDESEFPASGFVFTLAQPHAARISKADINRLLGYKPRYTWQGNLLITEDMSRVLADAVELVTAQ